MARKPKRNQETYTRLGFLPTKADTTKNQTPVATVTIPYINGTSETISGILQPYNIRVAHKTTTTL